MSPYEETIHAFANAITTLNIESFAACFAPNSEMHDPVGAPPWIGPEGARQFFSQFLPLLESIEFRVGEVHVSANQAAFTWTMTATGNDGRAATATGIDTVAFNDANQFLRLNGYWEPAPFVAALTAA